MSENRPQGRRKNVTGQGKSVYKRGDGLGSGPVGNSGAGGSFRPSSGGNSGRGGGQRNGGGFNPLILVILAVLLLGGGGGLTGLLGGSSGSSGQGTGSQYSTGTQNNTENQNSTGSQYGSPSQNSTGTQYGSGTQSGTGSGQMSTEDLISSLFGGNSSVSSGWTDTSAQTAQVDTSVVSGARQKRTKILGNGRDTVTMMVYMCGTDLESRSGMASSDLQEMANASLSDNINIIVYTGGCASWRTQGISSQVNQIWQVKNGRLVRLVDNAGSGTMVDPDNLSSFIQWCAKYYPANRNELIFWDHGGGSVSGYGYDEKNKRSGSMNLAGINKALKNGGVTFDFIGFDACLMSTVETALMLDQYADYMIASEETEPGIGWYYTGWLNRLSQNTSMPTAELGKLIIDDFVSECARKCAGQQTTLAITDLAELSCTVPDKLTAFSESLSSLIQGNAYRTVSNARNQTREFARSSRIDQIDLVHFALNTGNSEGKSLADAISGAVKYNRTSSNMTNAYGLSIYFPYNNASYVDTIVNTYGQIGMDSAYAKCIQQFASMETYGQAASGGSGSPLFSLLGDLSGQSSSYGNSDALAELLSQFLGSDFSSISGLGSSNTGFLTGRSVDPEEAAIYISDNHLDASELVWNRNSDGDYVLGLSEDQWALVHDVEKNVFVDDGKGYIDMGLDDQYSFDEDGNLIADAEGTWLAVNEQPVPYYHLSTVYNDDDWSITGYVPALLNGQRVNLIIVFDTDNPAGYIAGASTEYIEGETETIAKNMTELTAGDTLDFLCDYYTYDGVYDDSYMMGDRMTVTDDMQISDVYLPEGTYRLTYRLTDIYNRAYWTEPLTLS